MLLKVQNHNEFHHHIKKSGLRGLDGDASLLLVLPGIGGPALSGLGGGDNTGLGHQGVGQGGLAVIHVGDHGHVPDVPLLVHTLSHLVYREVHLNKVKIKTYRIERRKKNQNL